MQALRSAQQHAASIKPSPEENAAKYSRPQIERSNALMRRASAVLNAARKDLSQATRPFGGHRQVALDLVKIAISEIDLALKSLR
jgi:hypothetical protein